MRAGNGWNISAMHACFAGDTQGTLCQSMTKPVLKVCLEQFILSLYETLSSNANKYSQKSSFVFNKILRARILKSSSI